MSRSVNVATILGNLGSDPELRTTAGGTKVANVSVATSRTWNDKNGQKQEATQWHRLVMWDKLAEIAERYLKKGDSVYCTGEIEYRSYEDKDGVTKYSTEIRVRELVMLGGNDTQRVPAMQGGQARQPDRKPEPTYSDPAPEFPDDDDLPF